MRHTKYNLEHNTDATKIHWTTFFILFGLSNISTMADHIQIPDTTCILVYNVIDLWVIVLFVYRVNRSLSYRTYHIQCLSIFDLSHYFYIVFISIFDISYYFYIVCIDLWFIALLVYSVYRSLIYRTTRI